MDSEIQLLKKQISDLQRKVDDLYNPASFPQSVIDGLVKRGFIQIDGTRLITYVNPSGLEFFGNFAKFPDRNVFLSYVPKQYYLKIESVNTGSDTITITSHGFSDGDFVGLASTNTPPGGLNIQSYYIRDSTTNTFKLTLSPGGVAINITSQGLGDNYIVIQ